jgi:ribonuclease P protein component
MRFRAEQHLRRALDFQHVRTSGRRHDCGAFMLWYVRQAAPTPTVAVSTSEPIPALTSENAAVSPLVAKKKSPASIPSRVGVVASRSAVGNAVQRARAKRRLREVFRHQQALVPTGYDLLLVARSALNRLEYREIEQRFVTACRKIFPTAQA